MKRILFLFTLLLSAAKPLSAQFSLNYYLEQAATRNAALQNFTIRKKIAGLEIQKIKTQFEKPQWGVSGDYLLAPYFSNNGRVVAITPTPDAKAIGYDAGVSNGGLFSALVNVNYPVFTTKQSRPLVQFQELVQSGLHNQSQLLEADLKRRITSDYVNAYLVQQQMDYVRQVKITLLEQREFVRKLADRGVMRVTDLELLGLEIQNQDYQLNTLQAQYRQAMQVLNTDAGIVDTSLYRLDTVVLNMPKINNTSLFLEQYRLDSLAAVNDQAVFETRYLPQVNVFANGGLNAVELNNVYRKLGISAGIRLSWLFRDGGQRNINAQQNELRKLNAGQQKNFVDNQIQNNRQNNLLLLQQGRQNIQLLDSQLVAYQKLLTTYRQEFALGLLSVIDYLNVLRSYAALQQQKAQMETQLLLIINEINYWNN